MKKKAMSDDDGLTMEQRANVKMWWIKRQEEYLRTNYAPTEFKPQYELPEVTPPPPAMKRRGLDMELSAFRKRKT